MKFAMLAAAGLLFATTGAASADPFQNGSFESGAFVDSSIHHDELYDGNTAVTGWTVFRGDGGNVDWDKLGNQYGLTTSDGSYSLDLTGTHDNGYGGVRQTFDTIAGHIYSLSFDVGTSSTYSYLGGASVQALINGTALYTFVNPTNAGTAGWQTGTTQFTTAVGSTSTVLDLVGLTGGQYTGLDNVRVTDLGAVAGAVPEPATWAMMIAGFGLVGAALRRRVGIAAIA